MGSPLYTTVELSITVLAIHGRLFLWLSTELIRPPVSHLITYRLCVRILVPIIVCGHAVSSQMLKQRLSLEVALQTPYEIYSFYFVHAFTIRMQLHYTTVTIILVKEKPPTFRSGASLTHH